jgi:hypothetical protein
MTLRKVEPIDGYESTDTEDFDDNNYTDKYLFIIEGYSILNNVGFLKLERGMGENFTDAIFNAYGKTQKKLWDKFNIIGNEMKINEYWPLTKENNSSGFAFYNISNDEMDKVISEFREDEERQFMAREDK